jgi:hypothetical protein
MSSQPTQSRQSGHSSPRHPAEVPFFVFVVILNVAIIVAIIDMAVFLFLLPEPLKQSGWAVAIRSAFIALLLFVPALIVIRETQRAGTRGTAVQLSERQYPSCMRPSRALPVRSGCGGGRTSSSPTATARLTRSPRRRPGTTTSWWPTSCL